MSTTSYKAVVDYVDAASELAEHVKRCIQKKDRKLDNDAVLALNKLVIATHEVGAFLSMIENERKNIN